MVSYINSTRKPGTTEVLYKNLMVKRFTVLGDLTLKF